MANKTHWMQSGRYWHPFSVNDTPPAGVAQIAAEVDRLCREAHACGVRILVGSKRILLQQVNCEYEVVEAAEAKGGGGES